MAASKALTQVPRVLYATLEERDKSPGSSENGENAKESCPLDETAPEDIRITCAGNLDARLKLIKELEAKDRNAEDDAIPEIRLEATPEIRLEGATAEHEESSPEAAAAEGKEDHEHLEEGHTPEISLSAPESPRSATSSAPTTLLHSRTYTASGAHPKHESALLRLLYVHFSLNPANRSPQIASLLVPLYSALAEEIEPEDAAHIEADTFWLFEAMVGEFSELEEPETANVWMGKMSERLRLADTELAEELVSARSPYAVYHETDNGLAAIERTRSCIAPLLLVSSKYIIAL